MSGCSVDIFQRKTGKHFTWVLEQAIGKVNINSLPQTTTAPCVSCTNEIAVYAGNGQLLKKCQKSNPWACLRFCGFRSQVYPLPATRLGRGHSRAAEKPACTAVDSDLKPACVQVSDLTQGPRTIALHQHLGWAYIFVKSHSGSITGPRPEHAQWMNKGRRRTLRLSGVHHLG